MQQRSLVSRFCNSFLQRSVPPDPVLSVQTRRLECRLKDDASLVSRLQTQHTKKPLFERRLNDRRTSLFRGAQFMKRPHGLHQLLSETAQRNITFFILVRWWVTVTLYIFFHLKGKTHWVNDCNQSGSGSTGTCSLMVLSLIFKLLSIALLFHLICWSDAFHFHCVRDPLDDAKPFIFILSIYHPARRGNWGKNTLSSEQYSFVLLGMFYVCNMTTAKCFYPEKLSLAKLNREHCSDSFWSSKRMFCRCWAGLENGLSMNYNQSWLPQQISCLRQRLSSQYFHSLFCCWFIEKRTGRGRAGKSSMNGLLCLMFWNPPLYFSVLLLWEN